MVRRIVAALILVPLATVLVLLAIANRHAVTVSLDLLSPDKPTLTLTKPLFLVVFLALLAGVIVGGIAAWPRQRRLRRAIRRAEAEARALRAENAALRQRVAAGDGAPDRDTVTSGPRRLPAA